MPGPELIAKVTVDGQEYGAVELGADGVPVFGAYSGGEPQHSLWRIEDNALGSRVREAWEERCRDEIRARQLGVSLELYYRTSRLRG